MFYKKRYEKKCKEYLELQLKMLELLCKSKGMVLVRYRGNPPKINFTSSKYHHPYR